jgi:tetratricopeptide (TPR) repeat protein
MTASVLAFALLGIAQIDINVNVKDGDVLNGERQFRVTVQSKNPVSQVEFYVGEDLRDNDTSTPYEFKLDTLSKDDGPLRLTFAAYTVEGESTKKTIQVVIDNGVSKGASFHVARALELVQDGKWDDAITAGRVALKAQPGYNPARLVMARANLGKGVFDTAQKFAEDAVAAEAESFEALELLAAINLHRAFRTFDTQGQRSDTIQVIGEAMKAAVGARHKSTFAQLEKASQENPIAYADLAMRATRYSRAIGALQPGFLRTPSAPVGNRLAYAQVRAGRLQDALTTLNEMRKANVVDAYSHALLAVVHFEGGNLEASDDALRQAILEDSQNLGVQTAQAHLALKRNRPQVVAQLLANLARDQGQRTEVNAHLSSLAFRMNQFEESRRYFQRAVLAEPLNYDAFIDRGNESITVALGGRLGAEDVKLQLEEAKMLFETALRAKEDSFQALTGLSVVNLLLRDVEQALRYSQAAVAAGPGYAAAHFAHAAALTSARQMSQAMQALQQAGRLDRVSLQGRELPDGASAWRYFASGGRTPLLVPPK